MKNIFLLLLFITLPVLGTAIDTLVASDTVVGSAVTSVSQTSSYRYLEIEKGLLDNSITELITRMPGIQSKKYGGVGSFETVSIRGVDGRRIAVFVDGVPQASAMGGAVDLSRFSGLDIEAIEVFRGITPARFGGNSLGGAINIITAKRKDKSGRFSALLGSFGEVRGQGALSVGVTENVSFRGAVEYHRAENNYPYLDRNKTPYNESDDSVKYLQNNRFIGADITVGSSFFLNGNRTLTLDWSHHNRDMQIPGKEGIVNHTLTETLSSDKLILGLNRNSGKFTYGHTLAFGAVIDTISWTSLDISMLPHGSFNDGSNSIGIAASKNVTGGLTSYFTLPLRDLFTLEGRTDVNAEKMIPESDVGGKGISDWESERVRGSAALDFTFYTGPVSLITGGSFGLNYNRTDGGYDTYSHDTLKTSSQLDPDWSARFGANLLFADEKMFAFLNLSRYSRAPSLRELYGYQGGVLPTPDLRDETGLNGELGVSGDWKKISGEIISFANYRKDLITTISDGTRAKAVNLAEAVAVGIEQSLFWQIVPKVGIEENATIQFTEVRNDHRYDGNQLPNEPAFTIQSDLILGDFAGFTLHTLTEFKSRFYREQANQSFFPADENKIGSFTLSFILSWRWKNLTAEASLLNVQDVRGDDMKYLEKKYYGTLYPGRQWQARVGFEF